MTDHDWIVLTAAIAALNAFAAIFAALFYVIKEFISPSLRRHRLEQRAVDASFCITSRDRYLLKYVQQDDMEHETLDLVMPAHTNDLFLHILLKVRTEFYQSAVEFGFIGERDKVPIIKNWFHPFVVRGTREKYPDENHPSKDPDHYTDYHGRYHIVSQGRRPRGGVITYGFKIETRGPGSYPFTIEIAANGTSSKTSLTLVIEEVPRMKARCQVHAECFITPVLPH